MIGSIPTGVRVDDQTAREINQQLEELRKLKGEVKELKDQLGVAYDGTQLMEGYNQCLEDLRGVVRGTMEITRAMGPTAGLTHLLVELEKKDVSVTVPSGMPYDWLSRWHVTDRVIA